MFRLFRKKYAYPEVKCPRNAREMTDEEMLLVNGGGEKKEEPKNDTHTVVSGDTLSKIVYDYNKENGTNLTVSEVAKNSTV
jgi:LysM repeat protein